MGGHGQDGVAELARRRRDRLRTSGDDREQRSGFFVTERRADGIGEWRCSEFRERGGHDDATGARRHGARRNLLQLDLEDAPKGDAIDAGTRHGLRDFAEHEHVGMVLFFGGRRRTGRSCVEPVDPDEEAGDAREHEADDASGKSPRRACGRACRHASRRRAIDDPSSAARASLDHRTGRGPSHERIASTAPAPER